ncbi:MAG: hypothetical protein M3N25_08815 [Actinomycetota bacterium]|nr:hypothetical protein [Actinomycetota bacterium]
MGTHGEDGTMAPAHDGDEVGYELDDWGTEQRRTLSAALEDEGLAHRWEGAELVVAEGDADLAEQLIDEIDHPDALAAEDDGDDVAADVLSSLYVAADVLLTAPDNPAAAADLVQTAARTSTVPTPYGLDEAVWAEVRRRADELAVLVREGSDDGEVAAAARSLRQAVWPLV